MRAGVELLREPAGMRAGGAGGPSSFFLPVCAQAVQGRRRRSASEVGEQRRGQGVSSSSLQRRGRGRPPPHCRGGVEALLSFTYSGGVAGGRAGAGAATASELERRGWGAGAGTTPAGSWAAARATEGVDGEIRQPDGVIPALRKFSLAVSVDAIWGK